MTDDWWPTGWRFNSDEKFRLFHILNKRLQSSKSVVRAVWNLLSIARDELADILRSKSSESVVYRPGCGLSAPKNGFSPTSPGGKTNAEEKKNPLDSSEECAVSL